jgi:hypothetical protein
MFKKLSKYLPNYPTSRLPNRRYFLNLMNSVYKHSVENMAKVLKEKKKLRDRG